MANRSSSSSFLLHTCRRSLCAIKASVTTLVVVLIVCRHYAGVATALLLSLLPPVLLVLRCLTTHPDATTGGSLLFASCSVASGQSSKISKLVENYSNRLVDCNSERYLQQWHGIIEYTTFNLAVLLAAITIDFIARRQER
jgi:hypothetical protein